MLGSCNVDMNCSFFEITQAVLEGFPEVCHFCFRDLPAGADPLLRADSWPELAELSATDDVNQRWL